MGGIKKLFKKASPAGYNSFEDMYKRAPGKTSKEKMTLLGPSNMATGGATGMNIAAVASQTGGEDLMMQDKDLEKAAGPLLPAPEQHRLRLKRDDLDAARRGVEMQQEHDTAVQAAQNEADESFLGNARRRRGYGSTVLTGGQGVTGSSTVYRKTLLGG